MDKYHEFLIWASILCSLTIMIGIKAIMIQMDKRWAIYLEQEKELREWLFSSLYTINKGVTLPNMEEPVTINKKATVFSPTEEGMAEFRGEKDDWFGDDNE